MLERMSEFFEKRMIGYDEHMLTEIEGAQEFYPFTAACLPVEPECSVLDLGCGTGLELGFYFAMNPSARVTGIDLSAGMLEALRGKYPDRRIDLICGSYFDVPFPENTFDAAVSVESLHHFTQAEKLPLYRKVYRALKPGGSFVLTDYFALSEAEETLYRETLEKMKQEIHAQEGEFYHYDTPLTLAHEMQILHEAGFAIVEELRRWGATSTLRAIR